MGPDKNNNIKTYKHLVPYPKPIKMTKVAIVTGGNKGIGFTIVKGLAKVFNGDVFLTARNVERGMTAVKTLEKENIHVKFHQLDIDNPESNAKIAAFMKDNYGGIDILINNAAI